MTMNWESFIENLKAGQIIPVIGNDLILYQDENDDMVPLYNYIASRLLEKQGIVYEDQSLGELGLAYPNANIMSTARAMIKTLDRSRLDLTMLEKLAAITDFTFFVSTTPDNFLLDILRERRKLSTVDVKVHNYSPQPLSFSISPDKSRVSVFKLFGSFNGPIPPALNDEEMLEHVFSLSDKYQQPHNQLADFFMSQMRNKLLLLIGCRFPDWFMRFIIRIISYERYRGRVISDYIVWNGIARCPALNTFLKSFNKNIFPAENQEGDIRLFIDQLFENWSSGSLNTVIDYSKTVLISYSKKNEQQALKLKQRLRKEGINVWFEKPLSQPGKAQNVITHAVKKCNVFIPLLSEESLTDWYNNKQILEWKLIESRLDFEDATGDVSFQIIPVAVDNTGGDDPRIPDFMRNLSMWFELNLEKDEDRIIAAVKERLEMERE